MSNNEAIIRTPNTEHRTPNTEHRTPNTHKSALKILVCYYDSYGIPYTDDGIMFPIQAGKALTDTGLHIQGDNELNGRPCDNISSKNPSYSELTALYWAWKNLKKLYPDVKYVGWSHYRRFFALNEERYFTDTIYKSSSDIPNYRIDSDKIISILEAGKIILVKKRVFSFPLNIQFSVYHSSIDYSILKDIIRKKFPDYYDTFVNFMEHNNKISLYCMFIMKYEDFERYCEWLFAVLSEVEPLIPFQYYNTYQKRVFAFMAERLLNVYVIKNGLKPEYSSIYFYGDKRTYKRILRTSNSIFVRFGWYIFRMLRSCRSKLIFRLLRLWP